MRCSSLLLLALVALAACAACAARVVESADVDTRSECRRGGGGPASNSSHAGCHLHAGWAPAEGDSCKSDKGCDARHYCNEKKKTCVKRMKNYEDCERDEQCRSGACR